jgi:hypothetical protein
LAKGVRYKAIERILAKQLWTLSDTAIRHHAINCVPELMRTAADDAAERDVTTVETVRQEALNLMDEAKEMIQEAKAADDLRGRAACLTSAKGCLELLARITGDIGADIEIRVQASASWQKAKTAIIAALAPHPAALADVVAALQGVE